jgi:hypothetical protein
MDETLNVWLGILERIGLPLALVYVLVRGLIVPRWAYDALEKQRLEHKEAADRSTRSLEELVELFKRRGE